MIAATVPRAYVDVNREPLELDPRMFDDPLPEGANSRSERVAAGLGVIARVVAAGLPIYDGKLIYAEEKARIENIYLPYHAALQSLVRETQARCGYAILIDCHSMPSSQSAAAPPAISPTATRGGSRPGDPDIVLGDRYGKSCNPRLTSHIEALLQDMGYSVSRNDPYAGGYCTIRYGKPRAGVHAIQIEINRRLYMDESRIKRHSKAIQRVAGNMERLIAAVNAMSIGELEGSDRLAAE
jgi:N-formylglutamate amidohydrolase